MISYAGELAGHEGEGEGRKLQKATDCWKLGKFLNTF